MATLELSAAPVRPMWTSNVANVLETCHVEGPTKLETESARNQMITDWLPLVRNLARQVHGRLPQHVDLEDLVAAGTLGLVDAVSRCKSASRVQFRSYAYTRIKGAMLDSLRTADWSYRNLRRQEREMEEAIQVLAARGIWSPAEIEVANEMGLTLARYQQLRSDLASVRLSSLQAESEESGGQAIDQIQASSSEDPLFCVLLQEERRRLIAAIDILPEQERLVLTLFYYEELTMKEIAQVLGITNSRISQLHASALSRLGRYITERAA